MSYYAVSDTQLNTLSNTIFYNSWNYNGRPKTWSQCISYIEQIGIDCLKEGTQILMGDWTTKNIEEITYGDYVKSWDILTNQYIDVKVYGVVCTGRDNVWDTFLFSDGNRIQLHNTHTIYNPDKEWAYTSKEFKVGSGALNTAGERVEVANISTQINAAHTFHFCLYTENNLYFANGILVGHSPWEKIKMYTLGTLEQCTEEEVAQFRVLGDIYDTRNIRGNNPEYLKAVAPYFAELGKQKTIIDTHQAILDASDYKNNKYAQGLLTEEEYAEFSAECNIHRDAINLGREKRDEALQQIKAIQAEYGLASRPALKTLYKQCYASDMEFYHRNHATE